MAVNFLKNRLLDISVQSLDSASATVDAVTCPAVSSSAGLALTGATGVTSTATTGDNSLVSSAGNALITGATGVTSTATTGDNSIVSTAGAVSLNGADGVQIFGTATPLASALSLGVDTVGAGAGAGTFVLQKDQGGALNITDYLTVAVNNVTYYIPLISVNPASS